MKTLFVLFAFFFSSLFGESSLFIPNDKGELVSQNSQTELIEELPSHDYETAFFKMLLTLAAILLLLFFSFWWFKRLMKGKFGRGKETEGIHILERKSLSPKSVLYLVEVDGETFVVGESQVQIAVHRHHEKNLYYSSTKDKSSEAK